jgi:hypothetical protein
MMAEVPELVTYHVSNIYPQGLSLPIYCGYTKEGNSGAFMMHDRWGLLKLILATSIPGGSKLKAFSTSMRICTNM